MRWLATSGIIATSDPVRDRIVLLTRSISAATSATSWSIEASERLSKGTITAKFSLRTFNDALTIETAMQSGKGRPDRTLAQDCESGMSGVAGVMLCTFFERFCRQAREARLRELVRANDIVLVSAIGALLDGARIEYLVLDQNMSVIEGSLGVLPRRILVADDDVIAARRVIRDAGLAHELRPDD
jgi:hypothetical protein